MICTEEIAALTARYTDSDVRVGIKTLYYSATDPNRPLKEHLEKARRDIVVEIVSSLSEKSLFILRSAAQGEQPVKKVYQVYRQLCLEHREQPFSYMHFYSTLSYLQSLGLILLITTKIRRVYTKLIQLTFPADVVTTIWSIRYS